MNNLASPATPAAAALPAGVVPLDTHATAGLPLTAASISARLDRLPPSRYGNMLILLLSLGGWFEFYDLFMTAYVAPGLAREGLYTATTVSLFGMTGFASFVAAFFAGLFIGTMCLAHLADRFGRRLIFTLALLWYCAASVVMAFQHDPLHINFWRFMAGLGVGVELVTIDSYLSELVPPSQRGQAFAWNETILFTAVPVVALLGWLLVPHDPFGLSGWRWLALIGAVGAIVVWFIRLGLPESPRWLAGRGRLQEADAVVRRMEERVAAQHGPLPAPVLPPELVAAPPMEENRGSLLEALRPPYLSRTLMMSVFNFLQTVGFYGFGNWVPTLLIASGVDVTKSLFYTFLIAVANPFGPMLGALVADRIDRKWQVAGSALGVAVLGLLFGVQSSALGTVVVGVLLAMCNAFMSYSFHAYQPELFPTRIRVRAVGFVYSWSRLSAVFSGFFIAFVLRQAGVGGVFLMIGGAMFLAALVVALFGPRTTGESLERISR